MTGLLKLLKGEPVATMAVVTAIGAVLALFGIPAPVFAGIAGVIAAVLAFPVRNIVAPVAAVVETTRAAALDAAAQVASRLDAATAGQVGTITDHAAQLVDTAADSAADAALRSLGVKRKDRAG